MNNASQIHGAGETAEDEMMRNHAEFIEWVEKNGSPIVSTAAKETMELFELWYKSTYRNLSQKEAERILGISGF